MEGETHSNDSIFPKLNRSELAKKIEDSFVKWLTTTTDDYNFSLHENNINITDKVNKNTLIIISGKRGIGKSYLIDKTLKSLQQNYNFFTAQLEGNEDNNLFQIIQELLKFVKTRQYSIDNWCQEKKQNLKNFEISDLTLKRCISLINFMLHPEINKIEDEIDAKALNRDLKLCIKNTIKLGAQGLPIVLAIKNYQFIQSYRDFLDDLIRKYQPDFRIFTIITVDEFDQELLSPLLETCQYYHYELLPLDINETQQMITEIIPDLKLTEEEWNELNKINQGNPEFLMDFIDQLHQEGFIESIDDTTSRYKIVKPIDWGNIKLNWAEILTKRFDNFDEDQKYVLKIAAIIGENFSVNLLKKLVFVLIPGRKISLPKLLNQLEKTGIIHQYKKSFSNTVYYRFLNHQVWDYFYHKNPANSLQIVHWYIANEYLSEFDPQNLINMSKLPNVIEHLERAHRYREAHALSCLMVKHCINSLMLKSGKYWLNRAQQQWDLVPKSSEEKQESLTLEYNIAMYHYHLNDLNKSLELIKHIIAQESSIKNIEIVINSYLLLANIHIYQANYSEAELAINKALELAQKSNNIRKIGHCYNTLGSLHLHKSNLELAQEYFEKNYELQTKIGENLSAARSLGNLAIIHRKKGDFHKTLELIDQVLELSEHCDLQSTIISNILKANVYSDLGKYDQAIEIQTKALAISRDINNELFEALILANQALVYRELKDFERTRTKLEYAINFFRNQKYIKYYYYFLGELAELNRQESNLELAEEQFKEAIEGLTKIEDKIQLGLVICYYGMLCYDKRQISQAYDQLELAKKIQSETDSNQHSALGKAIAKLSDRLQKIRINSL